MGSFRVDSLGPGRWKPPPLRGTWASAERLLRAGRCGAGAARQGLGGPQGLVRMEGKVAVLRGGRREDGTAAAGRHSGPALRVVVHIGPKVAAQVRSEAHPAVSTAFAGLWDLRMQLVGRCEPLRRVQRPPSLLSSPAQSASHPQERCGASPADPSIRAEWSEKDGSRLFGTTRCDLGAKRRSVSGPEGGEPTGRPGDASEASERIGRAAHPPPGPPCHQRPRT